MPGLQQRIIFEAYNTTFLVAAEFYSLHSDELPGEQKGVRWLDCPLWVGRLGMMLVPRLRAKWASCPSAVGNKIILAPTMSHNE
jgi:hypothetical protein